MSVQRSISDDGRDIIKQAKAVGEVVVTDDDGRPEAVVLSMERYAKLKKAEINDAVAEMRAEWDRRLAVLNEPGADEKLRKFLDSTPEEIAEAANAAALRRKS